MDFPQLLAAARSALTDADVHPSPIPVPQATALLTADGHLQVAVNDLDGHSIPNAPIVKMVTVWKNGDVDLPSYDFRRALLAKDSQNATAQILLPGADGYNTKLLRDTF